MQYFKAGQDDSYYVQYSHPSILARPRSGNILFWIVTSYVLGHKIMHKTEY